MLLTDQSRAWIEVRLEAALRRHGEVDVTKLRFQPPGLHRLSTYESTGRFPAGAAISERQGGRSPP